MCCGQQLIIQPGLHYPHRFTNLAIGHLYNAVAERARTCLLSQLQAAAPLGSTVEGGEGYRAVVCNFGCADFCAHVNVLSQLTDPL